MRSRVDSYLEQNLEVVVSNVRFTAYYDAYYTRKLP
jgi:hypothetical protein